MARKNRRKRESTVGRILPIVGIRNRVYRELEDIAQRLGPLARSHPRKIGCATTPTAWARSSPASSPFAGRRRVAFQFHMT
jgi:hypothetical protein